MNDTFLAKTETLAKLDARELVGIGLAQAHKEVPNLVVLYADVGRRFHLEKFVNGGGYCLDTGISEQNMIGVAAGMCHEGFAPVAITYAPFITGRVFDQLKSNIGEMQLPIQLVGSTSGLSKGDLGALLMCTDDIAMLRTIPGLTIVSPADGVEVIKCFVAAARSGRPVYIRLTGGKHLAPIYQQDYSFEFGKAVPLRDGEQILVITTGAVTAYALAAADRLGAQGHQVAVLNMHTVKPLDTESLERYLGFHTFVTVEEHNVYGGLGSAVAEYLAQKRDRPNLVRLGVPDRYFRADRYENLMAEAGLAAEQLYQTLMGLLAG